ncbi:MAG: bifunctional phosphoribosyl-AMP cyclohydrolase/phosphoribosyl-ATP diphosphatase HisIE [Pseudomonadota bacterium]
MIIPSIDLFDGKAVQWKQGKEPILEQENVFELLEKFSLFGEVAIIDLNAATGKGDNRALITEMLKRHPCRVGGGIRDIDTAKYYIKAGATKLILGTACREDWVKKIHKNALIFSIDARGDQWTTHGWQEDSELTIKELIAPLSENCSEFLYTQVEKEGMMQGLDKERIEQVLKLSPIPVTIAGGVTNLDDVSYLSRLGANMQIGMALYSGAINLNDSLLACLDFKKHPLIPTVVQDIYSKDILMLAYSNQESITAAIKERRGIFYSRSRQALWKKGETSGHTQALKCIDFDCDADTLVFQVEQTGNACHLNRASCFPRNETPFDLTELDKVLDDRKDNAKPGSYTATLFADASLQHAKLREECEELIEAETFEDVRWEAADLLYFTLVNAKAKGVGLQDIINELRSRHNG